VQKGNAGKSTGNRGKKGKLKGWSTRGEEEREGMWSQGTRVGGKMGSEKKTSKSDRI